MLGVRGRGMFRVRVWVRDRDGVEGLGLRV